MLSIGASGAPGDGASGAGDGLAVTRHALAVRFHFELLHVCGQQAQALGVGDDGVGAVAQGFAIPHLNRCGERGQVLREECGAEMLVQFVRAFEHAEENAMRQRDLAHERNARPQRITPANPIPERKHILRRNAPSDGLVGRGSRGGDTLWTPSANILGVRQRFLRGESFRNDD